jgi:hypothetical protein
MLTTPLLQSYFHDEIDPSLLPPYFTLGAKHPPEWVAALDSSDQSVVTFDNVTGVAACRSGINLVGPEQEVLKRFLGEIIYVPCNPSAPTAEQLRSKLALEQSLRLITGRRYVYSSLKSGPPMLAPRMIAGGVRVVEDYRRLRVFANSVYAIPGMLFLADGRLNAQSFPGAAAIDALGRLFRARGIRYVGLAKDGMLVSVVRREARAIRRRVGQWPFAFPILKRHLLQAYRSGQVTEAPKTIRHGSSSSALGGIGAIRFALSLAGDHLCVVEMSLYDLQEFSGLVASGERLETYLCHRNGVAIDGKKMPAWYSWDLLPFVRDDDFQHHILPTLEEIVYHAYTDTELGIYPRALADIHNHIKLRFKDPDLEAARREIIFGLARAGVPVEDITVEAAGPHKTDPDEFDFQQP